MSDMSAKDVGERLGRSTLWVTKNLLQTGSMRAYKVGSSWRIREQDFLAWKEEQLRIAQEPRLVEIKMKKL